MKRNQLNVRFLQDRHEPGKYHDGWGLFLRVTETGAKSWVQRLTVFGRRRELGLGSFHFVTLAEGAGCRLREHAGRAARRQPARPEGTDLRRSGRSRDCGAACRVEARQPE